MKAIILAAGMGTRLGKYTEELPKCMLEFNGKPLIQHQIETLRSCGINDITIVKGYMSDKITIPNTKEYINKDYANTNMVETLFTAEKEMDDDVLVCYADILYEKRVIKKILAANTGIGVAVDEDYWDYWRARLENPEDDAESLVIQDGKVVDLGDTNCNLDKARVRYVGLVKFSKKGIQILKQEYHKNKEKYYHKDEPWLRSKSFKKAYMTCMLQSLINAGHRIDPIPIKKGWLEFDTVEDYKNYNRWMKDKTLNRFIDLAN